MIRSRAIGTVTLSVGLGLGMLALAPAAHAHAAASGIHAFIAGVIHPLTDLEHLLPLLALGLLAGQRGLASAQGLIVAFPMVFATSATVALGLAGNPEMPVLNAASTLLAGGLVAWAIALSRSLLYLVALAIGAIHGLGQGSGLAGASAAQFVAGATLAATLVFAYAFAMTATWLARGKPWRPVAVRALGSWIGAFGVITLALASLPARAAFGP